MGVFVSSDRCPDTSDNIGGSRDSPESLFQRPAILGLADAHVHGDGNLARSALEQDKEQLTWLLDLWQPGSSSAMATTLLHELKSLSAVLHATPADLHRLTADEQCAQFLGRLSETLKSSLRPIRSQRISIGNYEPLVTYLRAACGHKTVEQLYVFYLNTASQLIAEEFANTGTIDQVAIYPREILKRALELGAASLILAHNHPSGNPDPSKKDIELTRSIAVAGKALGIKILDHLIITGGEWSSMAMLELL